MKPKRLAFLVCALLAAIVLTQEAGWADAVGTRDADGDGCTNWAEHGSDPNLGGQRYALDFWDFFDTPDAGEARDGGIIAPDVARDGVVTMSDIARVVARFGSSGDATADPLAPPPITGYHPAFDRGGQDGPNPWDQGPADGVISAIDIVAVVAQFGHSCAGAAWGVFTPPPVSAGVVPLAVSGAASDAAAPGEPVVLTYYASNPAAGDAGPIRIDGAGNAIFRDTAESGSKNALCVVDVPDCPAPSATQVETGSIVGILRIAVDYRLFNTDSACTTWDEVVSDEGPGSFGLTLGCSPLGWGGNSASLQVLILPVTGSLCNGVCTLSVVRFRLFFLEGFGPSGCAGSDCEIAGRFITE